ncbi:MAG: Endo-1,4-beta-xylanase A precursor [Pelotomaculum sp. PtaU1.Bin035]|nr:MAG: Endo-1,4-beta-xylanase A precursor [Pelotomaculum sp. PtaU1.Bin035]
MHRNKWFFSLLLTLAVIFLNGAVFASEASAARFVDTGGHWAQQAIAEMSACDVIAGYPGGEFQPDKNVTMLEAVAMLVRVMGMEDQAKVLENENVDYKMPPNLLWGKGYLIMGVQMGMLDKDYLNQLQPGTPATRAEVAVLVFHALNLDPGGGELSFIDSGQIPQEYKACVAAVVNKRIMLGLPGNYFKPSDEINRGQMAVLLARLLENNFSDPCPERRFNGTLSSIDLANGILGIQDDKHGYVNKKLAIDYDLFLDGKKAEPALLKVGDKVNMILDNNEQIAYVQALRQSAAQIFKGMVDSIYISDNEKYLLIIGFDGSRISYPVAEGVGIVDNGSQKDISYLSEGKFVEVKVIDSKITEINFLSTGTIKGRVTDVSSSVLTVRKNSGSKTKLDIPDNVVVMKGGEVKKYSDVEEDNQVEVTVFEDKALKINILSTSELEGIIKELDTSGTYGITIRNDDGERYEYEVDDDVDVYDKNGDDIDFDELDTGDQVVLELDDDDNVTRIEVEDRDDYDEVEGEIEELDTSGTMHITISDNDGSEERYEVDDDVDVYDKNGDDIDFDELDTGDQVTLELDDDDNVTRIEVEDRDDYDEVEGEIEELDTSGTMHITISDNDGNEERYEVDDDVDVYDKNGDDIDFDELDTGDQVTLELDDDDNVTRIEVVE